MRENDTGIALMLALLSEAGCTAREVECYQWRLLDRRMTLEEIGAQLGISGAMVYRHLAAARNRLERLAASRNPDILEEMQDVEVGSPLDIRLIEHLVREDIEERHQVTGVYWWRPATLRKG